MYNGAMKDFKNHRVEPGSKLNLSKIQSDDDGGLSKSLDRAERALVATQSAMSDALGRMYAERYFPAEQKARLERISGNVRAALTKRVEAATWMSPATKASSLLKLKTLYIGRTRHRNIDAVAAVQSSASDEKPPHRYRRRQRRACR